LAYFFGDGKFSEFHSPLLIVGEEFIDEEVDGFGVILIECPSFSIVDSEISLS
jgi:hypothetical protein